MVPVSATFLATLVPGNYQGVCRYDLFVRTRDTFSYRYLCALETYEILILSQTSVWRLLITALETFPA